MEEDDVFSGIKTSISKYPVRTDNIFLEKTKWHGATAWDTPLNFRVCARWKRSSEILQNYISILQKTFRSFNKIFRISNFRFDALSHRSSGNSINVSENMGVVSNTSTPLNGSFENMGVANLSSVTDNVKKIHSGRGRGLAAGSQSPLGLYSTLFRSNQFMLDEIIQSYWKSKVAQNEKCIKVYIFSFFIPKIW